MWRVSGLRRVLALIGVGMLVGGGAGVVPGQAAAQDGPVTAYLDAVDAWSTATRLEQLLPDSGRAGTEARRVARRGARVKKATPKQLRRLRFKRRQAVTDRNVAVVAERLPGVDPATVAADIERNRELAHRRMRSFAGRWSPTNLADVAAFALLSAYASYNDRGTLSRRGSLAVLRAARNGLARGPKLRGTSNADKQTAAEMTEIRMTYAIAELIRARDAGSAADVSIARSEIRTWLREAYSLDVSVVRLTRRGFATP